MSGVSYGDDISIARSYTLVQWGTMDEETLKEKFGVG